MLKIPNQHQMVPTNHHIVHWPCLLSNGECLAIAPFKQKYKSEVLKDKKVALFKTEIMVAYFNYSHSIGQDPTMEEKLKERTKAWFSH